MHDEAVKPWPVSFCQVCDRLRLRLRAAGPASAAVFATCAPQTKPATQPPAHSRSQKYRRIAITGIRSKRDSPGRRQGRKQNYAASAGRPPAVSEKPQACLQP